MLRQNLPLGFFFLPCIALGIVTDIPTCSLLTDSLLVDTADVSGRGVRGFYVVETCGLV